MIDRLSPLHDNARVAAVPYLPVDFDRPGPSPAQLLAIVGAYKWLSLLIMLVVAAASVATIALWPRTYTATATLMVNYEVNDPLKGKELPVGQIASYIATQVELMQTPELVAAVVERLGLTANPDYTRGRGAASGTLTEWVAGRVARSLAVYQSQRGSQLVYVSFTARDRELAARVANTVVDVYQEQEAGRSASPPAERALRLAGQLEGLRGKVDDAQRQATEFRQRHGLVGDGSRIDSESLQLASLEEKLLAARNARRTAEVLANQDPSTSDQVLASVEVQALKGQLATQEMRTAELRRLYTNAYPELREAPGQLEDTRRALAAAVRSYGSNVSAARSGAQRLELELQRGVDVQRERMLARKPLQDEAAQHALALVSAQTVYRQALESYDQIMFASAAAGANVSEVSRAVAPLKASQPRVLLGLFLGAVAALVLGLGVPLVYESLHRRVRTRDDLERVYGVSVLAEFGPLPRGVAA